MRIRDEKNTMKLQYDKTIKYKNYRILRSTI